MKKHQSGFTLVEIAIVLVIIGLLLGGVLKGQAMIDSAKVKALGNEMKAVQTAYNAYQDKFRAVPGDDAKAIDHLGATVQGVSIINPTTNAGNGLIDTVDWTGAATPVATNKSSLFWMHTRAAGLITGDMGSGVATNSVGGKLGVSSKSAILPANLAGTRFVCSGGIDGALATQLDTMLDDGAGNKGSVQATEGVAVTTAAASSAYDNTKTYTVCMAF